MSSSNQECGRGHIYLEACDPGEPSGQCDSLDSPVPLPTYTQAHTHTHTVTVASVGLGYRQTRRGLLPGRAPGTPSTLDWFSLVLTIVAAQGLLAEGLDFVESPELH